GGGGRRAVFRPLQHGSRRRLQSAQRQQADALARGAASRRCPAICAVHDALPPFLVVRLTRIYTRGGDKGETSVGWGARVKKPALRVAAYGAVDEANAAIGLARLHAAGEADAMLARIQNDLFDLGADLCTPADESGGPAGALRIVQAQIDRLERE